MARYRVYGRATVFVSVEVEAGSAEDALLEASDQLPMLSAYAGNGGTGRLVGVNDEGQSISADEEIEYDDCKLLNEEEQR